MLRKILTKYRDYNSRTHNARILKEYYLSNQNPWTPGYYLHKEESIKNVLNNESLLKIFQDDSILPESFGYRIDERIVEYPWIFSRLSDKNSRILDAGSTLNFEYLVNHRSIKNKELSIYTFYPEENCYHQNRINYLYGDLRDMPYKDSYFDEIVCQSTIEHIDMDNSIYGYDIEHQKSKSFEYLKVISELVRILVDGGQLILTFPYGKFENHGFFQQFDNEMVDKIKMKLLSFGSASFHYYKYHKQGWQLSTQLECENTISYNPHTGLGKGDDGAAHCRSICCISFYKKGKFDIKMEV